jgi:hypothetical protein
METIIQKKISIEFEGKIYILSDEITIGMFLVQLGLAEDTEILIKTTKNGFSLSSKT